MLSNSLRRERERERERERVLTASEEIANIIELEYRDPVLTSVNGIISHKMLLHSL